MRLLLTLLLSASAAAYQNQAQYLAAISDESTNTSFVLVNVTDATTHQTKSGCVASSFLRGAILREFDLPYNDAGLRRAIAIASTPSHSFTFRSAAALKNVGFPRFERQNSEECALIRRGCPAVRGDVGNNLLDRCDNTLGRPKRRSVA